MTVARGDQDVARQSIWEAVANRRMVACIFTGLASGMPLFLLIQTVPFWLRQAEVSLQDIGLLSLAQLPYTWKFLWAPLLDRYRIASLPHRQGWIFAFQLLLAAVVAFLGFVQPLGALLTIGVCSVLVGFFSASLDIVVDAYRRELLNDDELGLGNSIHVQAYRISGLVAYSGALLVAAAFSWEAAFGAVAALMVLGACATWMLPGLDAARERDRPKNLKDAFVLPFREFLGRRGVGGALLVLSFIVLYKLGDSMATALSSALFVDLGFDEVDVATVAKNAALWPAIAGALVGGIAMLRIGINRALWVFGLIQLLTIFGFVWLAQNPGNLWVLGGALAAEYFGVGLGTAAFVAFMARETSPALAATQLALFTALAAVPRVGASAITGFLVSGAEGQSLSGFAAVLADFFVGLGLPSEGLGWVGFFYLCAALAVPGMLLLTLVAPWTAPAPAQGNQN